MNHTVIPLACRPELLLSPLASGEPGRYAAKDLRTGDCYVLGPQEYFLLARLDGEQTATALCLAFQERFGESLSQEELGEFVEEARTRGFLQPSVPEQAAAEQDVGRTGRDNKPSSKTSPDSDSLLGARAAKACCYDEIPYASRPLPQTHPDNLATVATLFGMNPPPVERCRVLELGCASGGNLIPLAVSLPDSSFVGIDLSGRQIADGRRLVKALGLRNVELRQQSILDVGAELGPFDYVLCHGVYSWVPREVQDEILEICARSLAPNGVAYVSYNTYPGWHLPGVVREMMRFHSGRFAEPNVRVRQARALLEFFAQAVPENAYGGALQKELQLLRRVPDHYLFHEYLAEENQPVYFQEFNARAESWGLQYLGEAAFLEMLTEFLSPEVENTLRLLSRDLMQAEQFGDFLRNRRFRQTLLCHHGVPLTRSLGMDCLERLHVACAFQPVSARPDVHSSAVEEFRSPRGLNLSAGEPLVKAALLHLAEVWPAAVPFRDLATAASARLGHGPESGSTTDARLLLASLLKCAGPNVVEFSVNAPRLVANVSQRPTATPLARLQAAEGCPVANLRHQAVSLSGLDRRVLSHLNGRRDRDQLVEILADCPDRDLLPTTAGGPTDPRLLGELVDQSLVRLARQALLVG